MHLHIHAKTEEDVGVFFCSSPTHCLETRSHTEPEAYHFSKALEGSELLGSPCLSLPILGDKHAHLFPTFDTGAGDLNSSLDVCISSTLIH